jgi:hypothetical protein
MSCGAAAELLLPLAPLRGFFKLDALLLPVLDLFFGMAVTDKDDATCC